MSAWSETIHLSMPLKDARQALPAPVMNGAGGQPQDEWQASFDLGKIEGEKALGEQLVQQRKEIQELMQGVLASMREAVPQVMKDTEPMLVSLALEVAQKIVGEIPISVPMVESAIRDALTQVEGTAQITIRLHPTDLELLQAAGSPLLNSPDGGSEFRFLGSPEVTRGGCLVQTRFGTVDARRETKFDLIKRSLLS
jgi:flagellar assembly protein FliH